MTCLPIVFSNSGKYFIPLIFLIFEKARVLFAQTHFQDTDHKYVLCRVKTQIILSMLLPVVIVECIKTESKEAKPEGPSYIWKIASDNTSELQSSLKPPGQTPFHLYIR